MSAEAALHTSTRDQSEKGVGAEKPRLVFLYEQTCGRCRRTEGHLAQALQRRRNHETFELVRIDVTKRPDLAKRLRVTEVPTLVVVEDRRVCCRIVSPQGCRELEKELAPWLR